MLFRTVYGPELASVYFYIEKYGPINTKELFDGFGGIYNKKKSSPINLEDALYFLEVADIIIKEDKAWKAIFRIQDEKSFKLCLLRSMRGIHLTNRLTNILDPYFLGFIDILFTKPNIVFQNDLHSKVNSIGVSVPCSEEKVNAWRRVLEYLNVGIRAYGGLVVQYDVDLVKEIISLWDEKEGPIQQFLEMHFNKYLPWKTQKGDIAISLSNSLERLEKEGLIILSTRQDLPSKSYFGSRKIKWIEAMV
jgi:hypothetical protein